MLYLDNNKKKRRSLLSLVGFILIYIVMIFSIGLIFYFIADAVCESFIVLELDWFYFALMSMLALILSVIVSAFSSYTTLYKARDNELLLSLPIPVSRIVLARLLSVWIWGFVIEVTVMLPTLFLYLSITGFSIKIMIASLVSMVLLSLLIVSLSCLFGWIVAKISRHIKHKSLAAIVAFITFIAIYYYLYFQFFNHLEELLVYIKTLGRSVQSIFPLYALGGMYLGDILSMIFMGIIMIALFAILNHSLVKSFFSLSAASNQARNTKSYQYVQSSLFCTLIKKEMSHFFFSAGYMLNCGLGTIMMMIMMLVVWVRSDIVVDAFVFLQTDSVLIVAAMMAILISMNDMTAPSISLEGRNLWLIQSLPISSWQVLLSKIAMQLLYTLIPALILTITLCIVLHISVFSSALLIIMEMLFTILCSSFGLVMNLKMPNLNWTNENVPIKQSLAVMLAMFVPWGFICFLGVLYVMYFSNFLAASYLFICFLLILALTILLIVWLKKKGTKILESL